MSSVPSHSRVSGLRTSTYSVVIPCAEADVFLERDQLDVGELAPHDIRRSVAGGVVDNGDLEPTGGRLLTHGLEALAEHRAAAVRDDHDFQHGAPR